MSIAKMVSLPSTCDKNRVGAVSFANETSFLRVTTAESWDNLIAMIQDM